jgi:peptidoglycan L-alanyl-D-glutamate endopeptidase CwlK
VGGEVRWDWPLYRKIADAFKQAAAEKGVAIVAGADWVKFRDGPHIELDRRVYM